jgi:long-chain acyl-CoA synthetase
MTIIADCDELAKLNKLSGLEKIKRVHLFGQAFTTENDLMTPTFKVKRNVAQKVFKAEIDAMYASLQ